MQENTDKQIKRPELLTLLCILTFIGSGLAAFSNLFVFLTYDEVSNMMREYDFEFKEFEVILAGGKRFFVAGFILYFISLAGALQMWKLRKVGFHLYAAAQIFILILPVATIEKMQFSLFSFLITAAFIIGYASQLKYMK